MKTTRGKDFEGALALIKDDQQALMGAAELYFAHGYSRQMSEDANERWGIRLAEIVLADGAAYDKSCVLDIMARGNGPKSLEFLRKVAAGQIGEELIQDAGDSSKCVLGLRTQAYLALAMRGDETVKKDIQSRYMNSQGCDRLAYEVALALLGEPTYLKREHFQVKSYEIGFAALKTVEKYDGKYGMEYLVEDALDHDWAAIQNAAVLVAEKVAKKKWTDDKSQPRNYSDEVKKWWNKEGKLAFGQSDSK